MLEALFHMQEIILRIYDMVIQKPIDGFKTDVLNLIHEHLPFSSAIWASGSHKSNQIFSIAAENLSPTALYDYAVHWQKDDLLRAELVANSGKALRNEDIIDITTHQASAIFQKFCCPNGMYFTLGFATADPVTTIGELVFLFRDEAGGAFNDDARDILQHVAPHMFAAWRQKQSLGLWSSQSKAEPAPLVRYAVIDDEGLIHAADRDFGNAVLRAVPDWIGPVLPKKLQRLVDGGRGPIRLGDQCFAIRRGKNARHLLLALDDDAEALTSAERRAARLYAAGATYASIAETLNLSTATVRNQLASTYRKLGVHNKVALASVLARIPD